VKCHEFSVGVDDALVNSDSSEISLEHTVAFSLFSVVWLQVAGKSQNRILCECSIQCDQWT